MVRSSKLGIFKLGVLVIALAAWPLGLGSGATGSLPPARELSLEEAKAVAVGKSPAALAARAKTAQAKQAAQRTGSLKDSPDYSFYTGMNNELIRQQGAAALKVAEAAEKMAFAAQKNQVEKAYLDILKAEDGLTVAAAQLRRGEEQLRVARAAFEAGTIPRGDVLSAEVSLANLKAGMVAAEKQREISQITLNKLMGLDQRTHLKLTTHFSRPDPKTGSSSIDLESKVQQARSKRLEVVSARETIGVKEVDFVLAGKYLAPGVPKYHEAEQALEEAKANLAVQQDEAEAQTRQAFLALQIAEARLQAIDTSLEMARENLRIANLRFEAGVAQRLETVAAEALLAQTENQALQAVFDYNTAKLNLNAAAGEGL